MQQDSTLPTVERRTLLKAAVAAGAVPVVSGLGWTFLGTLPAQAADGAPVLPGGMTPWLAQFSNWAGDIVTDQLWTVSPTSASQVAALATWAYRNGWRIRPRGHMHNWSPISVAGTETSSTKVLMVDTTKGMTGCSVNASARTVTAGAGISMEDLLTQLSNQGLGIMHHPAPGDITLGGALAIGGHGTGIPAEGETLPAGMSAGSLPNLVLSLDAVVYDKATDSYVVRTFRRDNPAIGALLCHVGRAFITSVTLRVGAQQYLRCQSETAISGAELCGAPGSGWIRTIDYYLKKSGRMEMILFPGAPLAWFKRSTVSPTKPVFSRQVTQPFNYTFADNVDSKVESNFRALTSGNYSLANTLGNVMYTAASSGLLFTGTLDIWGAAKNTMLYVKQTTLHVTANGYAVLCRRSDVQQVISDFYQQFKSLTANYASRGKYPMNGPLEIRVTGVDRPSDVGIANAQPALLSPTRSADNRPDLDSVVWFDVLTFPGTPSAPAFYAELEAWMLQRYTIARNNLLRVEWSKGWGYTADGAWTSQTMLGSAVPNSFTAQQTVGKQFKAAIAQLDALDPARIYSAPLHERLFPKA